MSELFREYVSDKEVADHLVGTVHEAMTTGESFANILDVIFRYAPPLEFLGVDVEQLYAGETWHVKTVRLILGQFFNRLSMLLLRGATLPEWRWLEVEDMNPDPADGEKRRMTYERAKGDFPAIGRPRYANRNKCSGCATELSYETDVTVNPHSGGSCRQCVTNLCEKCTADGTPCTCSDVTGRSVCRPPSSHS